jgi:hypothetical protein
LLFVFRSQSEKTNNDEMGSTMLPQTKALYAKVLIVLRVALVARYNEGAHDHGEHNREAAHRNGAHDQRVVRDA